MAGTISSWDRPLGSTSDGSRPSWGGPYCGGPRRRGHLQESLRNPYEALRRTVEGGDGSAHDADHAGLPLPPTFTNTTNTCSLYKATTP